MKEVDYEMALSVLNNLDISDNTPHNLIGIAHAKEAVKKQIPKKVEVQQWIYTKCECGYEFSEHHGDGYYSIPYDKKTNYCPKCGQALDWGDTE